MADRVIVPGEEWPQPDFVVVTSAIKVAPEASKDDRVVLATASSTSLDLDSDRFTKEALEDMAKGFQGLTIFLNHQYKVPVDIFGQVLRCQMIERSPHIDLDMTIRVTNHNQAAEQTYQMIRDGFQLGVSVGVLVLDYEKQDGEQHLGRTVVALKRAYPLEASVVGIPSNRRSWVQQAIKSLVQRGALLLDCDEMGCRTFLKDVTLPDTVPMPASKEGRRNSDADQKRIQAIHDAAMELGAECPEVYEENEKGFSLDNLVVA